MRLAILMAIACALVAINIQGGLANASLSLRHEWQAYKQKYGKAYESPEEDAQRFALFTKSKAEIEGYNGTGSHRLALNHLSDWTQEELELLAGFKVSMDEVRLGSRNNSQRSEQFVRDILRQGSPVPAEMDWRQVPGRVSAVKSQGKCGSCWAFSATGVLEGQEVVRFASNKSLVLLSEQNLVDCVLGGYGCQGGAPEDGLSWIAKMGGLESEQDYPYRAEDGACRFDKSKSVIVDKEGHVGPRKDPDYMRDMVAKYGPISTGVNANPLFNYKSGIIDDPKCADGLDHAVLIVGYGTDPRQGDFWIVKNSWGEQWGEQGYFRMKRGVNSYMIGLGEHGYTRKNSICKLKSNVLGTQFNAIRLDKDGSDDRCTIGSVIYRIPLTRESRTLPCARCQETNVLGIKGPRKMRVFLPKDERQDVGTKNLLELYKRDPSLVVQLRNMTPSWNVESQSYVLNFHGRVTQASVKNFQLVESEDHILAENQRLLAWQDHHLESSLNKAASAAAGDPATASAASNGTQMNGPTVLQRQLMMDARRSGKQLDLSPGAMIGDRRAGEQITGNWHPLAGSDWATAEALVPGVMIGTAERDNGHVAAALSSPRRQQQNAPGHSDRPTPTGIGGGNKSLHLDEQRHHQQQQHQLAYNSSTVMQFGRTSSHEFTCDVTYPLSILQAFSIALSSFDSKLACE